MLPQYQMVRESFAANAMDPNTGRGRFAIKQLQHYLLRDKDEFAAAASDMTLEAAYLARFNHPNIIALRGLPATGLQALAEGREDGYFLILDRLQGTLDERLNEWIANPIDERNDQEAVTAMKLNYAQQLASALHYLHQNRIIFRDLKPHNIGFDTDGQLKLFDFGLCRELPSQQLQGDVVQDLYEMSGVGTRRYMAPEIVRDRMYNDKADVYSFSLVLWQMFTLLKPYDTYSTRDHKKFVCAGGERPTLECPSFPHGLVALLEHAWCDSVSDRYTMGEVLHQLEQLVQSCSTVLFASTLQIQAFCTDSGIEVAPQVSAETLRDVSTSRTSKRYFTEEIDRKEMNDTRDDGETESSMLFERPSFLLKDHAVPDPPPVRGKFSLSSSRTNSSCQPFPRSPALILPDLAPVDSTMSNTSSLPNLREEAAETLASLWLASW